MADDKEEDTLEIISDEYLALLQKYRLSHPDWGSTARKHSDKVASIASAHGVKTILDFGCGTGTLAAALKGKGYKITKYDPAVADFDLLPEQQFDMVVCIDVMEHVEEQFAQAVINLCLDKADKCVYFYISCVPAKAVLPDGRNAHITLLDPRTWLVYLRREDYKIGMFNWTEKFAEYVGIKLNKPES